MSSLSFEDATKNSNYNILNNIVDADMQIDDTGDTILEEYYNAEIIKTTPFKKSGSETKYTGANFDFLKDVEPVREIDRELTTRDLLNIINCEIARKRINGHHIDSMNSFYDRGIKQIITNLFTVEHKFKNLRSSTDAEREIEDIAFRVEFTDVDLKPPVEVVTIKGEQKLEPLYPNKAREKSSTYSAQLYISAKITATAYLRNGKEKTRTEEVAKHRVASIPIMVNSLLCNLNGLARESLKRLHEDPNDTGGYFVINGGEWCVDNLENIAANAFHVHKNLYKNEIVRGTFLSKPGDAFENSYQVILRLIDNGAITVELSISKNFDIKIPFYLIFKILGITSDKEIVEHISYSDSNDPDNNEITKYINAAIERAYRAPVGMPGADKYNLNNHNDIRDFLATTLNTSPNKHDAKKDPNIFKYMVENLYNTLDNKFLPHMGTTRDDRARKALFLGHLINILIRVDMGVVESSDRDSYKNKRIHAAGTSIAKTFKTNFNVAVIQSVKKTLKKAFENSQFDNVKMAETVMNSIKADELENLLTSAIVSGNKIIMIKNNEVTNRVSSQQLYRKNDMNVKATLNIVNTANSSASKQNDRADVMRRVHASSVGYIDVSYSKDTGEGVGITKQMASTASVSLAQSSHVIKSILAEDPDIIPLDKIKLTDIAKKNLAKIFVNGAWIGCCNNANDIAYKYRMARRAGVLDYSTTIVCELLVREVRIWSDVGRLLRPLLIVYNNEAEYDQAWQNGENTPDAEKVKFHQWIKLTRKHVDGLRLGTITMDDLRREKIIEYISPEEHENTYCARDITVLRENENNIMHPFTHCDISAAILGILTLAAPMADKSSAVRTTYYTNHRKKSCGWAMANYPYRIDKNITIQYYCETPLINCFSDSLSYPNGQNAIIALMIYDGSNQEDSAQLNRSSVDCGLFNASYYLSEKIEIQPNENIGEFDRMKTMNIKKDVNREHLVNGYIPIKTIANPGDVLVSRTVTLAKREGNYTEADRSIVCKQNSGPVYIDNIIIPQRVDDTMMIKIQMRNVRHLGIGDKLCYTPDHQIATTAGWVYVGDITREHKIITMHGARAGFGEIAYESPSNLYKYTIDEPIVSFKSEYIDLAVTMNHNMYVRPERERKYDFIPAYTRVGKYSYFSKRAKSPGCESLDKKDFGALVQLLKIAAQSTKYIEPPKYTHIKPATLEKAILEIVDISGTGTESGGVVIYIQNQHFADHLAIMALYAGLCADQIPSKNKKLGKIALRITKNAEYAIIPSETNLQKYSGDVYCIEIPSHLVYVRRFDSSGTACPCWCSQSSRSGNKGIISSRKDRCDLPYTENGIIPDIIVNSQSIPTRMAINQVVECLLGMEAVKKGATYDATTFEPVDIDGTIAEIEKYGIKYSGHTRMFNGKTGDPIDTLIFIGPTTYQRLQQFVVDDKYAVRQGPKNEVTGQPVEGKAKEGGLRMGEMERDCISGHGDMRALQEKYHADSDSASKYVCRCGSIAVVNNIDNSYSCPRCRDNANISEVTSDKVSNVLHHYLSTMNVNMQYGLAPYMEKISEDEYKESCERFEVKK